MDTDWGTGARRDLQLAGQGCAEERNKRLHLEEPRWSFRWTLLIAVTVPISSGSSVCSAPGWSLQGLEVNLLTALLQEFRLRVGPGGSERVVALCTK